jgi:hypothetical protein
LFATVVAAVVIPAQPVHAQACCAGGALLTPARLGPLEKVGVGLQARVRSTRGTFAPDGTWSEIPAGDAENSWEQVVVISARLTSALQTTLVMPVVETHRRIDGLAQTGGGLGDLAVTGRYDLLTAGSSAPWPGVGLLAGVTAPTGRAPDAAATVLATDVTGAGTWDLSLGLGVEQSWERWYVAFNAWATHHLGHQVGLPGGSTTKESFSPRLTGLIIGGYLFPNDMAAAIYLNAFQEGDKTRDGRAEDASAVRLTTVGGTWVWPWAPHWRSQVSLFTDVPAGGFGRNQPSAYGGSLSVLWVWLPSV